MDNRGGCSSIVICGTRLLISGLAGHTHDPDFSSIDIACLITVTRGGLQGCIDESKSTLVRKIEDSI